MRKVTFFTSCILLVVIIAATVITSLAWYEVIPSAPNALDVTTRGYITLTYMAVPSYRNEQGEFIMSTPVTSESGAVYTQLPDNIEQMAPAVVSHNAIRDSLVTTDVKTLSSSVIETAKPATFRSMVQYVNHADAEDTNIRLRFAAEAYAIVPKDAGGTDKVVLSLQDDLELITSVERSYRNSTESWPNNTYLPQDSTHNLDYFEVVMTGNIDSTLTLTSTCYIRRVDELVPTSLRRATAVYINLTVMATQHTKTYYFYNYDAWDTVYGYAWGYSRIPIAGNTTDAIMTGIDGDTDIGIAMRQDPEKEMGDGFYFTGLEITGDTGSTTDVRVYYKGDYSNTVSFSPGYYDVYYTPGGLFTVQKVSDYPSVAAEYLGGWNTTTLRPVIGLPGWYAITIPAAAERIMFSAAGNRYTAPQTISFRTDSTIAGGAKTYYYNGTWSDVITDTDDYIYAYLGDVSSATAHAYNIISDPYEVAMTSHGNGWFSVEITSAYQYIYFTGSNNLETSPVDMHQGSGSPFYKDGKWYATPPTIE